MNNKTKCVFNILGVEPYERFRIDISGGGYALGGRYFYITDKLDVYASDNLKGLYNRDVLSIKNLLLHDDYHLKKLDKKDLLTEDDWTVLKYLALENIDTKYIARDKSGALMTYPTKPRKQVTMWGYGACEVLPKQTFSFVKWEDDEPLYVGDWIEELRKGEKR